jgi:protein TonB
MSDMSDFAFKQQAGEPGSGAQEQHSAQPSSSTAGGSNEVPVDPHVWAFNNPTPEDDRRALAKTAAVSAIVALGLGGVLYAAWPTKEPAPFSVTADRTEGSLLNPEQAALASAAPANAAGTPAEGDAPALAEDGQELSAEERAAMADDAGAASASLQEWDETGAPIRTDVSLPQGSGQSTGVEQAGSAAAQDPGAAAGPATQEASANPAAADPATATASPARGANVPPTGTATAGTSVVAEPPPSATVTRANSGGVVLAQPAGRQISIPPQWISGGPSDADNRRGRYRGTVVVQFTISPEGRVSNCAPVRSSNNASLDALTCRIVVSRSRYTPARDVQGRPVASEAHATYVWGRGRRTKS